MVIENQNVANQLDAMGAQVTKNITAIEPNSEPSPCARFVICDIAAEVSDRLRNEKISDRSQTLT